MIYLFVAAGIGAALIATVIITVIIQGNRIMSGLTDLQAAVAEQTTGVAAAVTAIQTLSSAGDSDSQIEALAQTISANNASLAAAVTAATPAPAVA